MTFNTLRGLICGLPGLATVFRSGLKSSTDLRLENAALRVQIQMLEDKLKRLGSKRHSSRPVDRLFWILLSRFWNGWELTLHVFQPGTIKRWHDNLFKNFWKRKSTLGSKPKRRGRPPISKEDIAIIRQIARDNPTWGAEHIADEMRLKLGIEHSPQTIKKYIPRNRTPDLGKPWWTFLSEHKEGVLCCGFFQQHLSNFQVVYVFVVMHLETRKVVGFGVTAHPTLDFVKQQLREVSAWEIHPEYLVHDNDKIFGQYHQRRRRRKSIVVDGDGQPVGTATVVGAGADGEGRKFRCHLDEWLHDIMGIEGLPIPYGAPKANAFCERMIKSVRTELLNHFIFWNEEHLRRALKKYFEYFNSARCHQGLNGIPAPDPEIEANKISGGRIISIRVLNGLITHYRREAPKAA